MPHQPIAGLFPNASPGNVVPCGWIMDEHPPMAPASAHGWARLCLSPLMGWWVLLPDVHANIWHRGHGGGGYQAAPEMLHAVAIPMWKGTKMVKTWRWGLFACMAAPLPCCSPPFSGSLYIHTEREIYMTEPLDFYIYISLSIHPHGSRRSRARLLVSSRGEASPSVPSPRGPPPDSVYINDCVCDVLTSLVYSDLPKPRVFSWFLLPPPPPFPCR